MSNTVNKEIWIAAPIEEVYKYFTKSELMIQWHGREVDLNPTAGGIYSVVFENGSTIVGKFISLEPTKIKYEANYEGVDSVVEINFSKENGGTKIKIQHTFLPHQDTSSFNQGWDYFLPKLKELW